MELVCTSSDPEWLEKRFDLITASETASLFDASPWATRDQLVQAKRNRTSDFKESQYMWWGTHLELPIMQAYSDIVGAPTSPSGALYQKEGTRVGATLDGLTEAPGLCKDLPPHVARSKHIISFLEDCEEAGVDKLGTGLIEIKNTAGWNMKKWDGKESEAPQHYLIQVQTQLFVTGYKWGVLCAKIGSADIVPKLVLAKPKFHASLEEEAEKFWKEVDEPDTYIK